MNNNNDNFPINENKECKEKINIHENNNESIINNNNDLNNNDNNVHNFKNQYTILNELGRGAFSVVYKVKSIKNGNIYCVKKIRLNPKNQKLNLSKLNEIKVLEKLNDPEDTENNKNLHLVNYYGSYIEDDYLYIIMEYCEYGDLYSLLHSVQKHKLYIQEDILWDISYQSLLGLDYIHGKKIIHRDIKLLNIFMNKDKVIKIGDMGMSKIVENDQMNLSRVGTPLFLAPELVKKEKYDYKIDLWSLGCSLYHLAKLVPPFTEENLIKLGNSIVRDKPPELPNIYSYEFKKLVNALLVKDKNKRVSAREAINKLIPEKVKHKYIEKFKNYKKNPFPIGYENIDSANNSNSNNNKISKNCNNTNSNSDSTNDSSSFNNNKKDKLIKNEENKQNANKIVDASKNNNNNDNINNNLNKFHKENIMHTGYGFMLRKPRNYNVILKNNKIFKDTFFNFTQNIFGDKNKNNNNNVRLMNKLRNTNWLRNIPNNNNNIPNKVLFGLPNNLKNSNINNINTNNTNINNQNVQISADFSKNNVHTCKNFFNMCNNLNNNRIISDKGNIISKNTSFDKNEKDEKIQQNINESNNNEENKKIIFPLINNRNSLSSLPNSNGNLNAFHRNYIGNFNVRSTNINKNIINIKNKDINTPNNNIIRSDMRMTFNSQISPKHKGLTIYDLK